MKSNNVKAVFESRCLTANYVLSSVWNSIIKCQGPEVATFIRCCIAEYQMRHTEPLLELASSISLSIADKVNYSYFKKHHLEERDHHAWGVADLKFARASMRTGKNTLFTAPKALRDLILKQYHFIYNADFLSFFGYIVALEGFPGKEDYWRSFSQSYEIDINAFSSPIKHASLDRCHSDELFDHLCKRYTVGERLIAQEAAVQSILLISKSLSQSAEALLQQS